MCAKYYGITPQHSSKRSSIHNHTKCDLYNDLIDDDGLNITDELLKGVRKGDRNALLNVAYVYDEEAKRCNQKSLEWALLAAVKESPEAQLKVASMLHSSPPGINEDYHLAMEWYHQAAKNGSVDALNVIKCMYRHGHCAEQDYITAREQFLRASRHGVNSSMNKTGADKEHGISRETLIHNIRKSENNLQDFKQDLCMMSAKINQSQATFENAVEKLTDLQHFFKTKIQEIEQRQSDSYRKRSRESENDVGDDEKHISKKRCRHKKFSCRWMKHFASNIKEKHI